MKTEVEAKLVTIYVNSTDQWHGKPLYSAIVRARPSGLTAAGTRLPPLVPRRCSL